MIYTMTIGRDTNYITLLSGNIVISIHCYHYSILVSVNGIFETKKKTIFIVIFIITQNLNLVINYIILKSIHVL